MYCFRRRDVIGMEGQFLMIPMVPNFSEVSPLWSLKSVRSDTNQSDRRTTAGVLSELSIFCTLLCTDSALQLDGDGERESDLEVSRLTEELRRQKSNHISVPKNEEIGNYNSFDLFPCNTIYFVQNTI